MRLLLPLLLLACLGVSLVQGQSSPAFPPLASQRGTEGMCLLSGLSLNNGLEITGPFQKNKFDYICSCLDWDNVGFGPGSPQLSLDLNDDGSYAQVWFNGQPLHTTTMGNPLSGTGWHKTVPLASPTNQWQVGNNLIQIQINCGYKICEYQYTIICNRPPPEGGEVVGDPQFMGLRGQDYQVHGVPGNIYNIVSDPALQYNSRFVFLDKGDCPVMNGQRMAGCWSHPGTYLGELGLKTKAGERIYLLAGPAASGFERVEVDGRQLEVGDSVTLSNDGGFVSLNSTHLAHVSIANWDFQFENSDMFVNQRVKVTDARGLRSHGLLGQTWRDELYNNAIKHVQGEVDDYVIREKDIWGDSFLYNVFN